MKCDEPRRVCGHVSLMHSWLAWALLYEWAEFRRSERRVHRDFVHSGDEKTITRALIASFWVSLLVISWHYFFLVTGRNCQLLRIPPLPGTPCPFLPTQLKLPLFLCRLLSEFSGASEQHHHRSGPDSHSALQGSRESTTQCAVAEEWCTSGAGAKAHHHPQDRLWLPAAHPGPGHHGYRLLPVCGIQWGQNHHSHWCPVCATWWVRGCDHQMENSFDTDQHRDREKINESPATCTRGSSWNYDPFTSNRWKETVQSHSEHDSEQKASSRNYSHGQDGNRLRLVPESCLLYGNLGCDWAVLPGVLMEFRGKMKHVPSLWLWAVPTRLCPTTWTFLTIESNWSCVSGLRRDKRAETPKLALRLYAEIVSFKPAAVFILLGI